MNITSSKLTDEQRAAMVAELTAQGWVSNAGAAIAQQTYKTACADKVAFLYFSNGDAESHFVILSGTYESEGRNVLSGDAGWIRIDGDAASVRAQVESFCQKVQKTIDESYARRLFLARGERVAA